MAVKLLFFAQSAKWMGKPEMEFHLSGPTTLRELMACQELVPLKEHLKILRIAINEEFATEDALIKDGDEIAFLPPVSGG